MLRINKSDNLKVKRDKLYLRIRKIHRSLMTLCKYQICPSKITNLIVPSQYSYGVTFASNLGVVRVVTFDEESIKGNQQYSIDYESLSDPNFKFTLQVSLSEEPEIRPGFWENGVLTAENVSLALYEIEKYIDENRLDKDSLEEYNKSEIERLKSI